MADFVQTMKDWRRMCAGTNCSECEITDYCEGIPCTSIDKIQQIVTAWAAEHPEPVYPTWAEWLNSTGLTKHDTGQFCVRTPNQYSYEVKGVDILNEAAYKPIPADIAEKLGIEPKECI